MTERELSQAVHLKAELDALRRVAAEEGSEDVLRAICSVHLGRLGSFALPFSLRKVVAKLIQLF